MAFGDLPIPETPGGRPPPTPSQHGWICDTIQCHCVPIDGAGAGIYSKKEECEKNCCPPPRTPGYNCVQGTVDVSYWFCEKVDDGARYKTLTHCRLNCMGLSAQGPKGPFPSFK